jgi:16S rRNA (guanine1207-N2)-methyltransferase
MRKFLNSLISLRSQTLLFHGIIKVSTISVEGYMLLQTRLLADTIQLAPDNRVLFLNSAADPFVSSVAGQLGTGTITLAEDNIASLYAALQEAERNGLTANHLRHVAFHEYTLREPAATMDVAIMNLLYQPGNIWVLFGLQVASYALKPGGCLYVVGARDRGVLSIAKRMQEYFGNVETPAIRKGYRVVCSRNSFSGDKTWHSQGMPLHLNPPASDHQNAVDSSSPLVSLVFSDGKLDEGTRLLLEALEVRPTDEALDIGCGAGFIGIHIARLANRGKVTMVDASLASIAVAERRAAESGLANIRVLASDGAQAVLQQRFDLVVTNPPFHVGGIQTTEIALRFIHEAAQVLKARGRFYLVANRFLKYEPALRDHFKTVDEVGGNTLYKVLRALS